MTMPERRPMVLEPLRRTWEDARSLATQAHASQVDKAGNPYYYHLYRVCRRVIELTPREWGGVAADEAKQIAWLHDVIQDTEYRLSDLRAEGFSDAVVQGVDELTKPRGLSYHDWIAYLSNCAPLPTLLVKIADVEDNSDPGRLALLPTETRARLEKKYGAALPVLKAAAERLGWKEISR